MRYLKKIVLYCIAFSSAVVVAALGVCLARGYDPSAIVSSALVFFGAELGLTCLTRIFAREDKKEERRNGVLGNVGAAWTDGSDRGD